MSNMKRKYKHVQMYIQNTQSTKIAIRGLENVHVVVQTHKVAAGKERS